MSGSAAALLGTIVGILRTIYRVGLDAYWKFLADEGWAVASHIALSSLMSLFPFLLVVTALAGFLGSRALADEAARILLEVWPEVVAAPIAHEIHGVLTNADRSVLTVGALLALYFASSGVESLRIGLNRAYDIKETRPWWLLRLESIAYVIVGAVALLALAVLVVFAPLILVILLYYVPSLGPIHGMLTFFRFGVAGSVLVASLLIVHMWLPAGHRSLTQIMPGILATLVLWLAGGAMFGRYLAEFAFTYAVYYAGLASAMIALVFLYLTASIFIYGGELNTIIARLREAKALTAAAG